MEAPKFYVVSNGRLTLHLEPADEGGFVVTSPFDPSLVTEADTIEEAFEMAEDAIKTLAEGRAKIARRNARQPKNNGRLQRKMSAVS